MLKMSLTNRRSKAFTLAEVLVTLGIIGVVSAMTIPALTQNWQKKSYVTQLHKVYNEFNQVFTQMINDNQAINLQEAGMSGFVDSSPNYEKRFMQENFKVVKYCGNSSSGCFGSKYRTINGGSSSAPYGTSTVTIAGGAAITIHDRTIYVDVNGAKGPNIWGRDMFEMNFYSDGTIDAVPPECIKSNTNCPSGSNAKQSRENLFNSYCKQNGWTTGCFAKILNDNWEMNY